MTKMLTTGAMRVLFVDDDPFYREMGTGALMDAGFDVVDAIDGAAALAALANDMSGFNTIDLIVLDLEMPGMSGVDVMQRIRSEYADRHIPILVITGHEDTASIERAFDAGATSFLAKPLNWSLFTHHVNFVLKADRSRREAQETSRVAESMSALKSRLISMLVNEFQAPLQSAYGFATLLKQETDGPIQSALYRSWISEVTSSVQRLRTTHVKMLSFGQSLSDGLTLRPEVLTLDALLNEALLATQDAMDRREIVVTLQHHVAEKLKIDVDRILLLQAFRTILEYAEKFSPRGAVIAIATHLDVSGDLIIAIRDATPTLSARQISDVLGNGGDASKDDQQATGLRMARVLLEAHQGAVRLSPRPEGGMLSEMILPHARVCGVAAASGDLRVA
jgi:two-component system, sensor histidine kinase and response regulator